MNLIWFKRESAGRAIPLGRPAPAIRRTGLSRALEPPAKIRFQDFPAIAQVIKIIGPVLHHLDALIPILASRIGAAYPVVFHVRQLALDGVGFQMPISLSKVAAIARKPCAVICSLA